MKHVFSTSEIPHLWFHQSQGNARNGQGNLYFEGDTIYSYGKHFPIARHVLTRNGMRAVLFTTETYSVTTSRHKSDVRQAIPCNVTVFTVPDVCTSPAEISKANACEITKAIAEMKRYTVPDRKISTSGLSQRNITVATNPPSEVKATCGKRLAVYEIIPRKQWTLTHIASGLSVYSYPDMGQAIHALKILDRLPCFDNIDSLESRNNIWSALIKANAHVPKTRVSRRHNTITGQYRNLQAKIAESNRFNEFFGYARRFNVPEPISAYCEPIATEYEAKSAERSARASRAHQTKIQRRREARDAYYSGLQEIRDKFPERLEQWR